MPYKVLLIRGSRSGKQSDAHFLLNHIAKETTDSNVLLHVAKLMIKVNLPSQAKQIAVKLQRTFEREKKRPIELADVSEIFSRLDMIANARDCLIEAQSHLDTQWKENWSSNFGGALTRARVLSLIAVASFRMGKSDEAKQLFNQAIQSAEGVIVTFDIGSRQLTWQYIAACLVLVGDFERAFSVITNGLALVGDKAKAYEQVILAIEYALDFGDISKEEASEAFLCGLRHAKRSGRIVFWTYLRHFMSLFVKLEGNVLELSRKIQVVEEVWKHVLRDAMH